MTKNMTKQMTNKKDFRLDFIVQDSIIGFVRASVPKAKSIFFSALKMLFRGYKICVSPLFPRSCRFYPTCSHFAYLSFRHSNPFSAFVAVVFRIVRCQPFCEGGFDYPVIYASLDSFRDFRNPTFAKNLKISAWFIPLNPKSLSQNTAPNKIDFQIHAKISKQPYLLIPSLA
ncbi:membrane protein insertion efficiency factor YidD [Helicobacter sp. T3_23-1056]